MMGPWALRLGGPSPAGPMESAPMWTVVHIFSSPTHFFGHTARQRLLHSSNTSTSQQNKHIEYLNIISDYYCMFYWMNKSKYTIIGKKNNDDNLNTPGSRTASSDEQYSMNLRHGYLVWFIIIHFECFMNFFSCILMQHWGHPSCLKYNVFLTCGNTKIKYFDKINFVNYFPTILISLLF